MCGIASIFDSEVAGFVIADALFAMQHRGQESCGISIYDNGKIRNKKGMGLVKDVLSRDTIENLPGNIAIGHVRYPTHGKSNLRNAQPHSFKQNSLRVLSLASNGDVVNYTQLRKELEEHGINFKSNNDGELLVKLVGYYIYHQGLDEFEAIKKLMDSVKGAYSTTFVHKGKLFVFRDPFGFRPLSMSKVDSSYLFSSETAAIGINRGEFIREVEPGEIIEVSREGVKSVSYTSKFNPSKEPKHCSFELIYFARPDGYQYDSFVYDVREQIGATLSKYDNDLDVDVVVPVPDSSNFIAIGYAHAKNVKFDMGLIRNHYVGRTFTKPNQKFRDEGVRRKFNPLFGFFEGKKVLLIDDSIVRGTTLRKIVRMLRGVGAKEVHIRIGSPPVRYPCHYGIDTSNYKDLIANEKLIDEICEHLEANSLKYLDIGDWHNILKDNGRKRFCYACLDGKYPIK